MSAAHDFGVVSYNVGDGPDDAKVNDLLGLAWQADVLCLQEASDRGDAVVEFIERVDGNWTACQGEQPGAAAVPILVDLDVFEVVHFRAVTAVGRERVGPKGAGPTTAKPKVITVALLRHRDTGRLVRVLNTHMLPSVTRDNLPPREAEARRRHYRRHVRKIARLVRWSRVATVLCMDANAERDFPPLRPLRRLLDGWRDDATHGQRAIDFVLSTGRRFRRRTSWLLDHVSSDHKAVRQDFDLT